MTKEDKKFLGSLQSRLGEATEIMQLLAAKTGITLHTPSRVNSRDKKLHKALGLFSPEARIPASLSKATREAGGGCLKRKDRSVDLAMTGLAEVAFSIKGNPQIGKGNVIAPFFRLVARGFDVATLTTMCDPIFMGQQILPLSSAPVAQTADEALLLRLEKLESAAELLRQGLSALRVDLGGKARKRLIEVTATKEARASEPEATFTLQDLADAIDARLTTAQKNAAGMESVTTPFARDFLHAARPAGVSSLDWSAALRATGPTNLEGYIAWMPFLVEQERRSGIGSAILERKLIRLTQKAVNAVVEQSANIASIWAKERVLADGGLPKSAMNARAILADVFTRSEMTLSTESSNASTTISEAAQELVGRGYLKQSDTRDGVTFTLTTPGRRVAKLLGTVQ